MQGKVSKEEDKNFQPVCTLRSTMDAVLVMNTELFERNRVSVWFLNGHKWVTLFTLSL